jgi:uncharacterized protein involved in exopolysaccharide biosynthesis
MSKRAFEQQQAEITRLQNEHRPLPPPVGEPTEAERIQKELDSARLRYSGNHPEIQRLLAAYQRAKKAESAVARAPMPQPVMSASNTGNSLNILPAAALPVMAEHEQRIGVLTSQLAGVQKQVQALEAERRTVVEELNAIQARISRVPLHEQELSAAARDLEIAKTNYRSFLDKKLEANVAANMESRHRGERFELLDQARVPERPIKPRRKVLTAAGSLIGLIFACGLALMLEWRRGVILGEWELPEDLLVLGRVPGMTLPNEVNKA